MHEHTHTLTLPSLIIQKWLASVSVTFDLTTVMQKTRSFWAGAEDDPPAHIYNAAKYCNDHTASTSTLYTYTQIVMYWITYWPKNK